MGNKRSEKGEIVNAGMDEETSLWVWSENVG